MAVIKDIRSQTAPSKTVRKESQISKIARHHSAGNSGDYFSFWLNTWKKKGWTKGGYHEIILRDGSVQLCYDPKYPTNGVGNHNSYIYNICLVGNGSFTEEQEATWNERCRLAMKRFNLSARDVLGHNEFSGTATACPGINMDVVRKRLTESNTVIVNDDRVMWGKTELKPGQLGKITVLKDINVWEDDKDGKLVHTRTLKAGGEFRVYKYRDDHGGQYYLGAGEWVTKMPDHIKYETPSKAMLERVNKQG